MTNFWQELIKKTWSVNTQKRLVVLQNTYYNHWWLSQPLSSLRRSNFNVIVIEDYLKLVDEVHTFRLDPTLLDLEAYNFTIIRLKVSTWSTQNLLI